jgi:hypothetical protein
MKQCRNVHCTVLYTPHTNSSMNCVQCLHSYNEHSRKINRVEISDLVLDSWIVRAVFFTDISYVFLAVFLRDGG